MSGPRHAMVLAAGRGERLRPLTATVPKPLIEIGGRTMLDRTLDKLADVGVEQAVVNVWHRAEAIVGRLEGRARPRIVVNRESTLLDTGGGTLRALPHLGAGPFFVAATKMVWSDGPRPALARLAEAWDDGRMDALLLVQPLAAAEGFDGAGDFFLDGAGRLDPRGDRAAAPYAFTSLQIIHPRLFDGAPAGAFSMWLPWRRALADGRLCGLVHDGAWCHVSTAQGLACARARSWDARSRDARSRDARSRDD
ncbi:MAG: nucleotidyltransferase family protein [Alphaproteobacteria bacterium]